ncbi:hypothetical protein EDD85DRAFT_796408 [Armillaria nabsnona]|nr:hypothetical protein EDD85DRAFT_796408 [Armillaria nabsnona]
MMFKQGLALLPLYLMLCAAAPGPKAAETLDTRASCNVYCCTTVTYVYNSYVGVHCNPISNCARPVCCTGTFDYYWWLRVRVKRGAGWIAQAERDAVVLVCGIADSQYYTAIV